MNSLYGACCWVPNFALQCEAERHPEWGDKPWALLDPVDPRRVWQVSVAARRQGVKAGLTVSQAVGLCPSLQLCEADPVYYDSLFARDLDVLNSVSPVVEPAELGRAYVGTDGLEKLCGSIEKLLMRI